MCLAFRRRDARRRSARSSPTSSSCSPRRGSSTRSASLGKLKSIADSMPKTVSQGGLPGGRAHRRRHRPRAAPDPALLAARPGAVHHPPGGDHEGPRHRRPQRRHVPDAGDRPPLDVHALADPQGRPRRPARRPRRPDPGRRRDRSRPGHRLLRERAAPQARRRADARRLPQGLGGRARQGEDRRPRGARERRDRAGGLGRRDRHRARGAVRRPHRLLHAGRGVPDLPLDARSRCDAMRSTRRSSSASRPPRTNGSRRRRSGSSCPRSG